MQTLTELIEYCNLNDPAGALMLTGEWGCGKTYLIENELKKALKNKYAIIRVSLFGIPSVEELHKTVKSAWINEKGGIVNAIKKGEKLKSFAEKINSANPDKASKTVVNSVLSVNIADFVEVSNKIGRKKVVLVFDDLERSELSTRQKLGAINEYLENRHIHVIIIADEEKIDGDYSEIKEKVVQRTVHLEPDYVAIVDQVIGIAGNDEYKKLLLNNRDHIVRLFAGRDAEGKSLNEKAQKKIESRSGMSETAETKRQEALIKKRPHNIRSLKSAIQDFERVFRLLSDIKIKEKDKWLLTFLSYSMAVKANLIKENKDESIWDMLGHTDVDLIYPGYFDSRLMPNALSTWIWRGVWKEDKIREYIEQQFRKSEDLPAKEQVVYSRVEYIEEDIAVQGMREILPEVYEGKLSLNEYIQFIINSMLVRHYDLVDLDIKWEKTYEGINHRLEEIIKNREEIRINHIISDLKGFSDEERKAYAIISEAREKSVTTFEINKAEYIDLFQTNSDDAFMKASNTRYRCFDNEMAEATLEGYKKADNASKCRYSGYFETIWKDYRQSDDIDEARIEKTREGFSTLKDGLTQLLKEYQDLPFKTRFTKAFIEVLDRLLEGEVES